MTASSASEARLAEAARYLQVLDAPGIGPHRLYKLLDVHGSIENVFEHLADGKEVPSRVRDHLAESSLDSFVRLMRETLARGDEFKLWNDPDYPANLGLWGARPSVLFYRGDLSHLGQRSLALVGRVDPTTEGEQAAYRFARKCVEHDITVVSGLAKGIDGASHRASLAEPPGYTYAVVGHGLDFAYPAENRDLYEVIPRRGAVISQFPLGVGPQRWTFPARNEAMCTLALGTVIVEGKPGCGSIIQADFSFKHGRPVFLLGRNLREGETGWAEELVAKGAHVVDHFDQVLDVVTATMGELWSTSSAVQEPSDLLGLLAEQNGTPVSPESQPYALLFDIDGVLADSRLTTSVALAQLASAALGRPVDHLTVDPQGSPVKALERLGVKDSYNVYKKGYDAAFSRVGKDQMNVFDDAIEGLKALRAAGVSLGAVTAQPARRAELLLPPEVRGYFDVFLTYNQTGGKKEIGIAKAIAKLGVEASRTAFIGDQSTDLEAARRAGVKGVGVLWGFSDAETLAKWPHELLLHEPREIGPSLINLLFD